MKIPSPDATLTRAERVLHSVDYMRIFRRGRCFRDEAMRIHFITSSRERSRVGLVVSRKIGKSVVRSRVKRRLRHVFRESKHRLPRPLDLVFMANPARGEAPIGEYREIFERFLIWYVSRHPGRGQACRPSPRLPASTGELSGSKS